MASVRSVPGLAAIPGVGFSKQASSTANRGNHTLTLKMSFSIVS
jgi:hypothetical protein